MPGHAAAAYRREQYLCDRRSDVGQYGTPDKQHRAARRRRMLSTNPGIPSPPAWSFGGAASSSSPSSTSASRPAQGYDGCGRRAGEKSATNGARFDTLW